MSDITFLNGSLSEDGKRCHHTISGLVSSTACPLHMDIHYPRKLSEQRYTNNTLYNRSVRGDDSLDYIGKCEMCNNLTTLYDMVTNVYTTEYDNRDSYIARKLQKIRIAYRDAR